MVQDIAIIGAGGLAQAILWTINSINEHHKSWNVVSFVSEIPEEWGKEYYGYPILKPEEVKTKHAVFGFGDPHGKKSFVEKYNFEYPNIIHPTATMTMKVSLDGKGIVVSAGTLLMPCSIIKSFVFLNVRVVIGHDAAIGEYTTVNPGTLIAGNCTVGQCSYIGVGVSTREKVNIGEGCVIGVNAAVVSDIPDYSMAVGVPAKVIKSLRSKS